MWEWIIIVVCYLIGAGFFRLLGGIGSASEALQGWGRNTTSERSPLAHAADRRGRARCFTRRPGSPTHWR